MINELRNPEILRKLGEWKGAGQTWKTIKVTLERDCGIKASLPAIQNAYDVYSARSSEIIAGDENLKATLKEAVLDTANQLKEINNIMREIIADAKGKPESKIAAAREVLNQLYFQEKLLNRMMTGFNMQSISKIEYTKVSVNNLEELEKAGYIKVIKRPGEFIDIGEKVDEHNDNNPEEPSQENPE